MDNNDDLLAWRMAQLRRQGYTTAARGHGRAGTSSYTVVNSELTTYITGLTTALSDIQLEALDTFISSVKTGMSITSLSEVFDALYVFAGETSESSLKNLAKNATHATLAGTPAPTFTSLEGFAGDGANGYINTNFNPSANGVAHTRNDASWGFYSRTSRSLGSPMHGVVDTSSFQTSILPFSGGSTYTVALNDYSGTSTTTTNTLGVFGVNRPDSASQDFIRNKTITEATQNSDGVPNRVIYIGAYNDNGTAALFDTIQISFAWIGKSLTAANLSVFVDAMENYMDANGKGVLNP